MKIKGGSYLKRGIYTIYIEDFKKQIDFELPQQTEIAILTKMLISILKEEYNLNLGNDFYQLHSKELDIKLARSDSLYKLGLWEGSILHLNKNSKSK